MWLATKYGFYSIVRKKPGQFDIRGRKRTDLERLIKQLADWDINPELIETPTADYRFRIILNTAQVRILFHIFYAAIDYPNFKGMVGRGDQSDKHAIYNDWWNDMYSYQIRNLNKKEEAGK